MSEELKRRQIIEDYRQELLKNSSHEQRNSEMEEFIRFCSGGLRKDEFKIRGMTKEESAARAQMLDKISAKTGKNLFDTDSE